MIKTSYDEKAKHLANAIDIAIRAFEQSPPDGYDSAQLGQIVAAYRDMKQRTNDPEPRYKNLRSLKYLENDVLTYFQEATGEITDFFWSELNKTSSIYKRENRLQNIIKRRKIRNDIEYDIIVDTIVPYQQEGLISTDNVKLLEKMMTQFIDIESRKKR